MSTSDIEKYGSGAQARIELTLTHFPGEEVLSHEGLIWKMATITKLGVADLMVVAETGIPTILSETVDIDVDDFGTDPEYMPLGQRYRECERAQKRKYSRLKTKAFRSLHQHVEGEFEPFVKEDRRLIPSSLIDKIREINHLDVRLHDFALELFDERVKESAKELDDEKLPPRLPI